MTATSTFITRACTIERATHARREQTSSPHYIPGRELDVPRTIAPNCRHARVSGVHRQTPGPSPDIPPRSESLAWVANSMTLIYGRRDAVLLDTFLTSRAMETSVWPRFLAWRGPALFVPRVSRRRADTDRLCADLAARALWVTSSASRATPETPRRIPGLRSQWREVSWPQRSRSYVCGGARSELMR
jgi:hypothetical protein